MLIVRLDAIGDALVTVPLLAALRAHGCAVSAVLTERNAQAFAASALERVHVVPRDDARSIASAGYDVALIPSEEPQAYELARDAGIPERVGFEHGLLGKPLKSLWIRRQCTRTVRRGAGLDTGGRHEAQIVYGLGAALLGGTAAPADATALRPLVADADVRPGERTVFQVTQKWLRLGALLEDVAQLARGLNARTPIRFVGAQSEREFADAFRARVPGIGVELFAELAPWKASIAAARTLVAPDSGAVHVAGMTGTPVVAAYAAEHFAKQTTRWRPWAAPQRLIALQNGWASTAAAAHDDLLSETARA